MSHPNEKMLRSNYEALSMGNADPLLASLSDDIQWHVSGGSPLTGDYTGKKEVLAFFEKMMGLYQGTLRVDVLDVLANDSHGILLTNERAEYAGRKLSWRSVHVWEIHDGKLVEFRVFFDDAYHKIWPLLHS